MKQYILRLIITAVLMAVLLVVVHYVPERDQPPSQIEQLQADVIKLQADLDQLRTDMTTEMEDIKNVQGFMVWQAEWEDQKWKKGAPH